ncbi:hypothetical protein CVT26_006237 [Gymnopilus dilepis]|uniref:Uncharacterized protein n=1 Tax=Gymnopilus dilepis TaxID=231916 RepID=A0A409WYS2_9AGAR|nr:hypothetical protein CVT26_006237 [Gymnopilus dilepis]
MNSTKPRRMPKEPAPQDINSVCLCPHCISCLPVNLAVGGKFPGQYYLHCHQCGYHHTFPPGVAPRSSAASQPTPGIASNAGPLLPPSIPVTQGICARMGCSKPSHSSCRQAAGKMCKPCCIMNNGCSAPGHQFHCLSARGQEKLKAHQVPPPPPPLAQPDLPAYVNPFAGLSHAEACDLLEERIMPEVRFVEERERQANKEAAEAARLADKERILEREEESQYQAAVAASLGLPYTVRDPPAALSSAGSLPVPGPSSIPARRPSPIESRAISKHLNADWMRPYADKSVKPRATVRKNAEHRFRIVFWGENDKPPVVCAVDDCPSWPQWILMDSKIDVREQLTVATMENLQFYDISHFQWVACSPSYGHDVKKDGYLFLRRPTVSVLTDFDHHLSIAQDKAIHFRHNMVGERAYIKEKLRQRKKLTIFSPPKPSSDSEVEFVELSPRPMCGSSPEKVEDEVEFATPKATPMKRPSHDDSIDERPFRRQRCVSALSPVTPLPSRGPPIFISVSPSPSPSPLLSLASQPEEIFVPPSSKPWPHGMYTIDMMNSFRRVDNETFKGVKLLARLEAVFPMRDVKERTFQQQRQIWKGASEQQRTSFVLAGRTPAGLWSAFRDSLK